MPNTTQHVQQSWPARMCCCGFAKGLRLSVSHSLLLARLEAIGVGPKMLAAIKSLYSPGTLCMKIHSLAGQPQIQQNGVRQNCPLSPTLLAFSLMAHKLIWTAMRPMQVCSWILAAGSLPWSMLMMLPSCHGPLLGSKVFSTAWMSYVRAAALPSAPHLVLNRNCCLRCDGL